MKKSEIVNAVFSRKPFIVGVYVGHQTEVKRNENPKKNQSAETYISKHSILWGSKTFELSEFKNSDAELQQTKPLCPEFTPVAVLVDSVEETKWGNRMKGKVFMIEVDDPKK